MNNSNEKHIDVLRNLIEINRLSNKGYKDASDNMDPSDLKTILYRLSQQRALFEAELKDEVRKLGGEPEGTSTFGSKLYDTWLNFKSGLNGNDTEAILKECRREELNAVNEYESALKHDLPQYIKEKVIGQHKLIKGALVQLMEFQDNPS